MALGIPKRLREAITTSYGLDAQRRDEVLEAFRAIREGSRTSVYEEKLDELLPDYSPQQRYKVLDFMFTISSLTDAGRDAQIIAQDIVTVLRESGNEVVAEAKEEDFKQFEDFVLRVMHSQDSVGVRAKASRIRMQQERVFRSVETYSDIRSLFPQEGPRGRPKSAVIVHSLKVEFLHNNTLEELFLAVDYQDLEELKSATERAMDKHQTLSEMIEDSGLTHVKFGGEE